MNKILVWNCVLALLGIIGFAVAQATGVLVREEAITGAWIIAYYSLVFNTVWTVVAIKRA
jgi:hypothetical protein